MKTPIKIFLILLTYSCTQKIDLPEIVPLTTPSTASLRGISAVSDSIIWVSGSQNTVLKSLDAGQSWTDVSIADSVKLDFRDIEAFNESTAIVMNAGFPGRIYKTKDGGAVWKLVYEDYREGIFLDAMDFWDENRGVAFSDPIDGKFVVIRTEDGGDSWMAIPDAIRPDAKEGEGGFAASGSVIKALPNGDAIIATTNGRIIQLSFKKESLDIVETPIKSDQPGSGIFSIDFFDDRNGIAVGGDYSMDSLAIENAANTNDGGSAWQLISGLSGYRSAVSYVPGRDGNMLFACGTSGVDYTVDGGETWVNISSDGYHAIDFGSTNNGWMSGAGGSVARIVLAEY
ncbi:MAG: photosystem II stability/assembly factor-like protein [Cyclobacteriaceae bacterium]